MTYLLAGWTAPSEGGLCSLFSFVTFLQQTELSHLETVNIKKNLIVLFCLIWISLFIKM